ncbi:MAG: dCTP deaminase [Salinirussus sp.]
MILSDGDIRRRLDKGDLVVEPLDDPELQIQPASLDMRLGREFLEFKNTNLPCIHPDSGPEVEDYVTKTRVGHPGQSQLSQYAQEADAEHTIEQDQFILHPRDFVLGTTKETVKIPDDLIAHVEGRSSLGRLAIVVHATAGVVDPGYEGQITLELSNLGRAPVALTPDMRISQLTFTELKNRVERPYGEERGSKYQGQSGPQTSRIRADPDFGNQE